MNLSGEIKFKGPGLKKEMFRVKDASGAEFDLHTAEGSKPEIQSFDIWIEMDRDKEISIKNDVEDGERIDKVYLEIESKNGGKLSISLSAKQVAALVGVLSRFSTLFSNHEELKKVIRV